MPKFIVDLWRYGYDTEEEMEDACEEFIREKLKEANPCLKITKAFDPSKLSEEYDINKRHRT